MHSIYGIMISIVLQTCLYPAYEGRNVICVPCMRLPQVFDDSLTGSAYVPLANLIRICAEEDRLPTLSELFSSVPTSCGFDIEIKMTAGSDVERTPPEEVDRVVDAIWDEVSRHQDEPGTTAHAGGADAWLAHGSGTRSIFFSSFDPGQLLLPLLFCPSYITD